MKLSAHLLSATIISTSTYILTKSFVISITSLFSGILIDVDHLIDYFIEKNSVSINIKEFFYKCHNGNFRKIFLFFHSYEITFFIVLLYFYIQNDILLGLIIGVWSHMILDILYNTKINFSKGSVRIVGYSFFYRLAKKFDASKFYDCSGMDKN